MILQDLRLRHFRGIRSARLGPLSERLNLFHGANESGKSTMVEALHFGLFERSAGEAENKRALRTWGGGEAPEVEIALVDDDGVEWFIHKRFLDRPHTSVDIGSLHLEGEAAERRLRELVGTRAGTRHGVPQSDLGIWPLLWIRQGEAGRRTAEAMTEEARARLLTTLAAHTGEIALGTEGRRWLDRARERSAAAWTDGGRPTGALREALEAVEEAARRVTELEERRAASTALARELEQSEAERADLDRRCERLTATVERLRAEASEAARAGEDLAAATREHELARIAASQAAQAVDAHARASVDLQAAQAEQAAVAGRTAGLQQQLAGLEQRLADARAAVAQAIGAHADAAEQVQLARAHAELAQVSRQRDALAARILQARGLERRLREVQDSLAARLRADEVDRLEHEQTELDRARTRAALTTTLTIHALRDLVIDGREVPAGAELVLPAGDRALALDGLARLTVHTSAGERPQDPAEVQARVDRLLARLGVASVAEARQRLDLQRAREVEAASLRAQLAVVAPQGAAPLLAEHDALDARVHPPPAPDLDVALRAERIAADALAAARAEVAAAESARQAVVQALADLHARGELAAQAVRRHTEHLAALPSPEVLRSVVERQQAQVDEATRRLQAARAVVPSDDLGRRLTQEQAALGRLAQRRDQARDRALQLRHDLRRRRAEGAGSLLAAAMEAHTAARRRADALRAQAEVDRALFEALDRAARDLQQRLAAPVQQVVASQVARMFPGSELLVDPDSGDVVGLRTRHGRAEPTWERFDQLSAGAREQLAILVRLGIARVLAGPRRLPVLLDDALVNADTSRRAAMIEVLREASEHLQVLVFTCHDEDFDRLGADHAQRIDARPPRGR